MSKKHHIRYMKHGVRLPPTPRFITIIALGLGGLGGGTFAKIGHGYGESAIYGIMQVGG